LFTSAAGTNFKTFEFRVLPESSVEIAARISDDIENAFERIPKFWDITRAGDLAELIVSLDDFLSVDDLSVDSASAKIVWSIKDANVPKLQNSSASLATGNLLFVDPLDNTLRLGQNALNFNGDVSVEVTATIEIRYNSSTIAADVSVAESFTIQLIRDVTPSVDTTQITLYESGVSPYAAVLLTNAQLNGAQSATAKIAVLSGTTVIVSPVDVVLQSAKVNETEVLNYASSLLDSGVYNASTTLTAEVQISYSYYVDGKLVVASSAAKVPFTGRTATDSVDDIVIGDVLATAAANNQGIYVLELTGAVFRPTLTSGNITLSKSSGVDGVSSNDAFNNFVVVDRPAANIVVLRTSGNVFLLTGAETSGVLTVGPSAYFLTSGTSGLTIGTQATYQGDVTSAGGSGAVAGDNLVQIQLTNAVFRSSLGGAANSGLYGFDAFGANDANRVAILSGILANNIRRIDDRTIIITASSGLSASTTASGQIKLDSGLFIITSGAAVTAEVEYYLNAVTLSGLQTAGNQTDSRNVKVALAQGSFKTDAQGFDPSAVVFFGSGTTATPEDAQALLEANSAASVINAALAQGLYTVEASTLIVQLSEPLTTKNGLLGVRITSGAIARYAEDGTVTAVTLTRAD
jgi:hypothetical protein